MFVCVLVVVVIILVVILYDWKGMEFELNEMNSIFED